MKSVTRVLQIGILFFVILISLNSLEPAWAQEESLANSLLENSIFSGDSNVGTFLIFVIGIAIYALFVWYFYRFISKRNLLPKFFYPLSDEQSISKIKLAGYVATYVGAFPLITFVWFIVLAFFVFFISKEMPFEISLFVSMTVIAVVRILAYYREDAAKEIAKMIPYALLSFFLTSAVVYADPNFFTDKELRAIPEKIIEHLPEIIDALVVIVLFEFSFRLGFIIKRRIWPASEKQLDETIESEVESISKVYFKKMQDKQTKLEDRIEELQKKLDDSEKNSMKN